MRILLIFIDSFRWFYPSPHANPKSLDQPCSSDGCLYDLEQAENVDIPLCDPIGPSPQSISGRSERTVARCRLLALALALALARALAPPFSRITADLPVLT